MALFTVYAASDNLELWGFHDSTSVNRHKQGKVPLHEPLAVIDADIAGWFQVEKPAHISVVAEPYPSYWVEQKNVLLVNPSPAPAPGPAPVAGALSDAEIAKFVRWALGK
jgi:hypothetical protein